MIYFFLQKCVLLWGGFLSKWFIEGAFSGENFGRSKWNRLGKGRKRDETVVWAGWPLPGLRGALDSNGSTGLPFAREELDC